MKNLKNAIYLLFFVTLFSLVSCETEEDINHKKLSMVETITKNDDLASLATAITKTGFESVLASSSDYTFLAPTNEAFASYLTDNGYASVNDVPTNILREILLNHLITGEFRIADLSPSGYMKTNAHGYASSTNFLSMYVRKVDGETMFNGVATVLTEDMLTANGVIHKIDAVLELPSIVDHVVANPNLSTLVNALTLNGTPEPDFVAVLSGVTEGPYTVFAPVNSGFTSFLAEIDQPNLASINPSVLSSVLKYHVIPVNNALSNALEDGDVLTTSQGQNVSIQRTPANFRAVDANNRLANLMFKDIQCYNGMIHLVDNVMLPSLD